MEIICKKCQHETVLEIAFEVHFFSCPKCKAQFNKKDDLLEFIRISNDSNYFDAFELGQVATFNDTRYTITGIVIKRFNAITRWAEYILQSQSGEFLYLSESDGNFILLEEIDFNQKVGNHPLLIEYQEMTFDRYDYTNPTISYASGFFDFDVLTPIELIEYIQPPYILSFEITKQSQTNFYGKHISRSAVKKAFNTSEIPTKSAVGMVQPFVVNFRNLVIIFGVVAVLILLSNWYLNKSQMKQEVLDTSLAFDQFSGREYVSPSFELKGSSAPMKISLKTDVNNSWANVQIGLVNEQTGEETFASKDIEYYHGYTDGENWTEGDTSEDFNLCGVAAGKYHLTVTPQKAPEDLNNYGVTIKAVWNEPSSRNVYMTLIFMAIVVFGMYYASKYFEERRWGTN
jgi:hypothetical protein